MGRNRGRLSAAVTGALVVIGLTSSAMSATPAILPPADAVFLTIISGQCMFGLESSQTVIGQGLDFGNSAGGTHTVSDEAGFWSFKIGSNPVAKPTNHAGTYTWLCDGNEASAAPIGVRMSGPASTSKKPFKLIWANSHAYGGYRYSVQYKIGSSGKVATWRSKVSARFGTLSPSRSNVTYFFRAMTWRTSTVGSGWSAWKTVHVT